jgi:type I restriction enzyme R subunit
VSNFAFVKQTLPAVHADCARAEAYLTTDPRTSCIYARRAAELLVGHLYDVLALPAPYKDDLSARINAPAFKTATGLGVNAKLNLIRHLGNSAVHAQAPIQPQSAVNAIRELHHVMTWAAFHHSPQPGAVPTGAQFDPTLASKMAPLSRAEVQKLADTFKKQDEAHAAALSEKDELLAAHEAEIARLREEIKAAQAANTKPDDHDYDEATTRDVFIDVLLGQAGWVSTGSGVRLEREYRVASMGVSTGSTTEKVGYADYVLWGADGLPLAVVEAKRAKKSAAIGQQQATLYADALEREFGRRPVMFWTNGYEHWIWDDVSGYPPRQVHSFYTRDELELMIQRRHTRLPLAGQPIDVDIVERPYQHRAIRAVGDAFDRKQREALLVMATGSGKTRTVIAMIDQLMKTNWVKRVLFLADRKALVNQAANAFKQHLPDATTVNLITDKDVDGRVYVSTYPTMLNLLNDVDDKGLRRFGPGYFDLIVIDEAHRSVYAKYGFIFDYFDAMLVGLTATPKDEVDHNTYRLFHLEDGVPTDAYSLEEAVSDGYLVPPRGVKVDTFFMREGIRYADLSDDERDEWDALEWGDDGPPSEVGSGELDRFLFNEDTTDKVLAKLMSDGRKVAGGDRLGKTIIFAKNQAHAEFIGRRFDVGWPHLAGQHARVITHATPYAQSLIDDFSIRDKAPHIAISVDMLDTGIDVPEVVNLVFLKTVRSKSKFWQMIGRGTRLCPDLYGPGQDKEDFFVLDFCGNLEYFSQDLPGSEGSVQKSLTQRIFESRLGLVTALDASGEHADLRASTAKILHAFVSGMTLDNVLVRPHRRAVERLSEASTWERLTPEDAEAALVLGGLPTTEQDNDEDAKRFDLLVLRRQVAQLDGDAVTAERLRETIQAIASALLAKTTIPSVAEQAVLLESIASEEWWIDVTLPMLELVRVRIRALVRFVEKSRRNPVYTDFVDELGQSSEVSLPGITPAVDFERFRAKAQAYLREHEEHIALQRLRRNRQLTGEDLAALEQMLIEAGADRGHLARAAGHDGGLGVFIRSLVGLDRVAAQEAFAGYLDESRFSVQQIRFIDMVIDELTANGAMEPARLFESPYTDNAPTGPEFFFPGQVGDLVAILDDVTARATVAATG